MAKMTKDEKDRVCLTVCHEGFDYAFTSYSTFEKIKDKKFHELREAYVAAQEALANYIGWPDYEEL